MSLGVTGGVGGIEACLEDLTTVSRVLLATAATVTEASDAAAFGRFEIGGCSGLDLGAHNAELDSILAGLTNSTGAALRAAGELRAIAMLVRFVAESYRDADSGLVHMFTHALTALPGAVLDADVGMFTSLNPLTPVSRFFSGDPELVDLFAAGTLALRAPSVASGWCADGNPVVTDEFSDTRPEAVDAPRSVSDLVTALAERNEGDSGEISVSFVFGAGGIRHAIVDIPGTKSWSALPTPDVTSMATNLRAIDGAKTSYERGVLQAMAQAGVTEHDDVMLVGHSEGGMVAVAAARDAVGTFHVSHVVTAGAPIGRSVGGVPRSVQVLALEDGHDIVPKLDGADNPDLPNVTTVVGGPDHSSIGGNHHLQDSYLPLAESVDASDNASIRAFTQSAHGFLDQPLMSTERFVITREY